MMHEDIIRMMRESGLKVHDTNSPDAIECFVALVAAAEREACAKENAELLQALQNLHQRCHWADAPEEMDAAKAAIEKAIRARGET